MKYLFMIGLLFLSGCKCKEVEYERVSPESLEWLFPYDNKDYFVFEDEQENRDSLKINRISDEISCNNEEECSKYCETEKAFLSSNTNSEILFVVEASMNQQIYVNSGCANYTCIILAFNILDSLASASENFNLIRRTDYFEIKCKENRDCSSSFIKGMILTKQEGLIEYTTADNRKWTKVN